MVFVAVLSVMALLEQESCKFNIADIKYNAMEGKINGL